MTAEPAILVAPSPLHARTAPLCLTNSWVQESRLTLVDVYRSLEEEYWALREGAGMFDASAFFSYRFAGPDAEAALEHLLVNRVGDLGDGDLRVTLWCDDYGHVIGLGRIMRLGRESFALQTRARALAWFQDTVGDARCRVEEMTGTEASLGLVGPRVLAVLDQAGLRPQQPLELGRSMVIEQRGLSVRVARTGACGSPAYRLWVTERDGPLLWDRLMAAGMPVDLKPVGAAARDLARIEAGLPRHGVDFVSALEAVPWTVAATPHALGLEDLIDTGKESFVGRAALRSARTPVRKLVRLQVEAEGPYAPAYVVTGGKPIGFVTSGAWSPLMAAGFAFAWVDTETLARQGAALRLMRPPRLALPPEPAGVVCAVRDDRSIAEALKAPLDTVPPAAPIRLPAISAPQAEPVA